MNLTLLLAASSGGIMQGAFAGAIRGGIAGAIIGGLAYLVLLFQKSQAKKNELKAKKEPKDPPSFT